MTAMNDCESRGVTGLERLGVALALCAMLACGSGVEPYRSSTSGTGGSAAGSGGTAGSMATGGSAASSGGSSGTGGVVGSSGGAIGSAGTSASGGAIGSGGAVGSGGKPATLALPWTDDFEANSVGTSPQGWVRDPGDPYGKWAVVMDGSTKVLEESVSSSETSLIVGGDSAWADQKVEVRVKFSTVTSSSLAYIASRLTDLKNYYFLEFKGDGSLKIRKKIGDSTTDILSHKTQVALVAGTWYTVGIGFKGNTLTAYLDGGAVATMTETAPSISNGGIAIGFKNGAGVFDDVKVTAP